MQDLSSYVDALIDAAGGPVAPTSSTAGAMRAPADQADDGVEHSTRRRSPTTVGRAGVLAAGQDLLESVSAGRAHPALVLLGEAGHGKSRILNDLASSARASGLVVVTGRAVPGARSSPYRPLAEAATRFVREQGVVLDGDLVPYAAALRLLVPGWDTPGERAPIPALVTAEALTALFGRGGEHTLLVLDDLHWADEETLAVVEVLADLAGPVALVLAARPGPLDATLSALEARDAARTWTLDPLPEAASAELAQAVTGGPLPHAVTQVLHDRSEGVPLVVEELVNALIRDGVWETTSAGQVEPRDPTALFELVPHGLQASVGRSVEALSTQGRAMVRAAAVLGRESDLTRVATVAGVPPEDVDAAVAELVDRQLMGRVARSPADRLRFAHALDRDAVIRQLQGRELRDLAERALAEGGTEIPAAGLEQRADLALIAERPEEARALFVEVGRQARAQGALASAERALQRAASLQGAGAATVQAELAELLALAGRNERAAELARRTLATAGGDDAARLHLTVARVEEVQGHEDEAAAHVEAAAALRPSGDPDVALVRSRVALVGHDVDRARVSAESALRRHVRPEQACEALELLGRCARDDDEALSERLLEQMARLADAHGLLGWRLRALSELGILDVFRLGGPQRLLAARATAQATGDLVTAAMMGYHEAVRRFHVLDVEGWQPWVDEIRAESRAYGLDPIAGACEVLEMGFGLLTGAPEQALATAALLDAADPDREREAALWGIGRTTEALLREDLDGALSASRRAVGPVAERGGDPSPTWGTWAFLEAVAGHDGPTAEIRRRGTTINQINAGLAAWGDALRLGRAGETEQAANVAGEAVELLAPAPWYGAIAVRHAWPLARDQGWSAALAEPTTDAVQTMRQHGWTAPASALTALVGLPPAREGEPSPWGLTAREAEILAQVATGRSNAEIAEVLVISPRTVEKHVERLLQKTGARSRIQLALLARP